MPCYRGQQLRNHVPCQAAASLGSRALLFTIQIKLYSSSMGLTDTPVPLPSGATATTAASGGNREELLGPRHFYWTPEARYGSKRAGLATEGSGFWTSAPCQAVAGLDSGALPFPRYCASLVQTKADRHANGSPFGELANEVRLRGQATLRQSRCAAMGKLFVRAILSLCQSCLAASLPSQALRAAPRGRALGEGKRHLYNQKSPRHAAERAGGFSYKAEGCGNSPPWELVS